MKSSYAEFCYSPRFNKMALSAILIAALLVPCLGQNLENLDDLDALEEECLGEGKFQCLEGSCIPLESYCDGKYDCPEGSDEDFCPQHLPDPEFCNRTHHFLCRDKLTCIPLSWICNNNSDCHDGSDEANCTVSPHNSNNSTCKGFSCDAGKTCISELWLCDGEYDCRDKTDEIIEENCRHKDRTRVLQDAIYCQSGLSADKQYYRCNDSSYCLPSYMMCNGINDCRDGSDEGKFCTEWHTMCEEKKNPCAENITRCYPERLGPACVCVGFTNEKRYNYEKKECEDVDECAQLRPYCSHFCDNVVGRYSCRCDEGYKTDPFGYLCYATGSEGLIFFTTADKIAYMKIKSKQEVVVAQDIKQAHGVSYDGTYVYWVQTAQGHQAIMRAQLEDFESTKQVLVSLGLEDPGDIAVDWLGGHLYFTDAARGAISVCRADGAVCTTLHTYAKQPRFVTLDVKNGTMYWADWHHRPLIMKARMDGSNPEVLIDNLHTFATGLALDVPNGRLYYVDKTIKVFKLDDKQSYSLFEEPFHHPYAIAVFENTIFWSDWTSNSIQTIDKVHGNSQKRFMLTTLETPVYDMHVYHPVLYSHAHNPCENASCSHLCLVVTNTTSTCACPAGMELKGNSNCEHIEDYHPLYLVVGGGSSFIRLDYNSLGNPEAQTTHFDIGRVQAMAYDSTRDTLYLYDGQRKSINYINMTDFTLGVTHLFMSKGLEDIVDMDYDYATDSLYIVDAGRRFIEVISLRTQQRALLARFTDDEIPLSICVMSDYGKMLVAVMESEQQNIVHIDSIGLDGQDRKHLIKNDVEGPRIRLGYDANMDVVYMADDGNGVIELMHPEGTGRETFRRISTTVASIAVTESYLFWTDRRTRLYWSNVHEASHYVRRFEFTMFPENTQLHIQATIPPPDPRNPLLNHTCLATHPCSHVCVQTPHAPLSFVHRSRKTNTSNDLGYRCLCPPGLLLIDGTCTELAKCNEKELYCHKSNECFPNGKYCDGVQDCTHGEDEEDCNENPGTPGETDLCSAGQVVCNNVCIDEDETCTQPTNNTNTTGPVCSSEEYQVYCSDSTICISRVQMCDGQLDCPSGSDENPKVCDTLACQPHEYMCATGSCILKSFVCDSEPDCSDWSDEANCTKKNCGLGFYQCRSRECIELRKRCDGYQDCIDLSDEEACEEPATDPGEENLPRCTEQEYTCELNRSICIPLTARCNNKVDCPGGTDEMSCDFHCAPHGKFECRQEVACVEKAVVCNGNKDCLDGSDETPEACYMVNKTSSLYPPTLYPAAECHDGFLCRNGQCIEWRYVCDKLADCFDGSDENGQDGQCLTSCNNHTCAFFCVPTPAGPHCMCPPGLRTDGVNCYDVDECKQEVCSHVCLNIAGTFVCSCHHGYALRSDRRTCKATNGEVSVLYSSGSMVWSISSEGESSELYANGKLAAVTDIDIDIRRKKLFVTIADLGALIEVSHNSSDVVVTNIGTPTKVAVDWLTGNVYFADSTPSGACIRVCNVARKHCARLQKMPPNTKVTSLVVDPPSGRMFYCLSRGTEHVVWSATLAGYEEADLATVRNCAGMAVDSFKQLIYVAETGPARILRMNFNGKSQETVIRDQSHMHEPHGLALFEDHIYFLTAGTLKMNRCSLFGKRLCDPFIYHGNVSDAFVLNHTSVQRDDVGDPCEGVVCRGLCVGGAGGSARCMCGDLTPPVDNECRRMEKAELPLFNGWSYEDYRTAHNVTFTVVTSVLVLFSVYLVIFIYYHLVHKPRRARTTPYMEVRFQNASDGSSRPPTTSVVEIAEAPTSEAHEFVNPLEYVRDIWDQVRRQRRPVGTAGLEINVPYEQQILSDTESDLDEREIQQMIRD